LRVRTGACRPLCAGTLILVALLCAAVTGAASADAPVASSSSTVALEKGDRGLAVKKLQRSLHVSPVDGDFGRITLRAVKRFQRRRGLAADGVVGTLTRRALGLHAFSAASVERSSGSGGADAGAGADSGAGSTVRLPRVLRRIAKCESGGDPTAVSPGGRYRGKFQFTRATWRALGGSGDPAEAAEATQDRLALKLYRRSGTDPWPTCAKA
jgi:peptidoglycan hydrolase-like protein with peptidoglycan-binding domain